jgi:hypothetical protein
MSQEEDDNRFDTMQTFQVWKCAGCGFITQAAEVSCDCQVPALQDWDEGVAVFAIREPNNKPQTHHEN